MGYVLKIKKLVEHEWKTTKARTYVNGQDDKPVLAEEIETPALVWKWFASPVEPTLEALFEKYGHWCSTHKDNWCIVPQ
jgi:hypothetical protein